MAKQSSVNLDITNNADGFDISGGTTVRKLGITGGDVTIAGSGSAVVTFPTTSTTIAGLGITQSFSALQSFSAGISAAGGVTLSGTLQGTTANFTGLVSSTVGFSGPATNITGVVTSFNNQTGAVTGVTVGGTNVFTALNTFSAGISAAGGSTFSGNVAMTSTSSYTGLASFAAGISASGATFGGSVRFQNAEYIKNTTDGRMDFMPAPAGSTHYGMYMDFTSWSYGVKLGTIRASDNALNAGNFLWESSLSIYPEVQFNLGSDGQYNIVRTTVGNDTAQFSVNCNTGQNSGAFAIVDSGGQQTANRSPGVTHANPNLYVYRSGSARATDFIRMEHDGTNGRIVSGGTSGISLEPGSGVVGISGGISASGMVVLAQGVCGGYGNDVQSYGYTSGYDIIPTNWQCISANITTSPNINSVYLAPINISKKSIIKSIATQRGIDTTGNTGNFYLGLYNSNLYGLPNTLVYSSPSTTLSTGNFGVVRVSNVNYTANPGAYWIGIVFSAAGLSAGLARYGGVAAKMVTHISSSPVAQSVISGLTASTSGFTLPTNLNNLSLSNVIGNDFPAVFFTAEGAT